MIILASRSPRRIHLLRKIGINFQVVPSDFDESLIKFESSPHKFAIRAAFLKARCVQKSYPEAVIMGFDTIVTRNNKILGKPSSVENAQEMLNFLRGEQHSVITGIAILYKEKEISDFVESRIWMRTFSDQERDAYIDSGESFDKAGGYAIQGSGGLLIERYEGCYHNIVGIPLLRTIKLLGTVVELPELNIFCSCE